MRSSSNSKEKISMIYLTPLSATIIMQNNFLSLAFLLEETLLMTNFSNRFPKEYLMML
jgi:hypothetical protein